MRTRMMQIRVLRTRNTSVGFLAGALFGVLLLLVLLSAQPAAAGEANGGYAGAFLQVPAGARPSGMGGAYTAISDDGAAPLFNPAGLAMLRRPLLGTSYRAMQLDRVLSYATAAFPIQGQAAMAVHWLYGGSGSVETRDADGDLLGHEINQNSHQFAVVFAKRFERYLAVGANISYLASFMPEMDANSVGFDFGAMIYVDQFFDRERREDMAVRDIRIGLTAKNFAKELRWNSEDYQRAYTTDQIGREQTDNVPVELALGLSARFLKRHLLLATDFVKSQHQSIVFRSGAEYYVTPEFALRAGYGNKRFTAGMGYQFRIGKHQLVIDYAFNTEKVEEGSEHIFSFDFLY